MYLNAKRFIWNNEEDLAETIAKVFPELAGRKVKEVIVEAMYWRKSNQIHRWFVEQVQEGEDNCQEHWVSREKLTELRDIILAILASRNPSKLPPLEGFFFGSTEVDEWYWGDLETTAKELTKVLEEFPDGWDFYYHSSW